MGELTEKNQQDVEMGEQREKNQLSHFKNFQNTVPNQAARHNRSEELQ